MKKMSNVELSKQMYKLDCKMEILICLFERIEKTMYSIYGDRRLLSKNMSTIKFNYDRVRDNINEFNESVDKLFSEGVDENR